MDTPIVSHSDILRTYRAALGSGLDHDDAVAHAAGVHLIDTVKVEGVVQGREAAQQAMELAA